METQNLQEIANKDPSEMTKEDLIKLYSMSTPQVAETLADTFILARKKKDLDLGHKQDYELYVEDLRVTIALLGLGKMPEKKYATNAYFPRRW